MNGIYDDGAEYGSDRTNDRRERYAAALYHQDYPNTGLWQYAESDAQGQYREYADAAMAVADAEHRERMRHTTQRLTEVQELLHDSIRRIDALESEKQSDMKFAACLIDPEVKS